MKFSTNVTDQDTRDPWVLTFGIIFGKRKSRVTVEAINIRTREKLSMPDDYFRLTGLLPWDDWLPFARDQFAHAVEGQQERLF